MIIRADADLDARRRDRRARLLLATPVSCASRWSGSTSTTMSTTRSREAFAARVRRHVAGDRHRLARRHGLAHLGATARPGAAARRRRGRARRAGAGRRARPPGHRPVLLRADGARGRHRGHGRCATRRPSARSSPCTRCTPTRRRSGWPTTRPTGSTRAVITRDTAAGRTIAARLQRGHGQRQRGLRSGLGEYPRADGRHGRLRARSPARRRGPAEVHRVADGRHAARCWASAPSSA